MVEVDNKRILLVADVGVIDNDKPVVVADVLVVVETVVLVALTTCSTVPVGNLAAAIVPVN